MENKVVIALDAMGGDYAPVETVKGAVEAVNENKGMKVILVGREEEIKSELAKYTYEEASIEIMNATEIIDMGEVPTKAIREKKDSSLVVAMKLVRDGKADAIVSAGKYRCHFGWWTTCCWSNQRNQASGTCTIFTF